MDVNGKVNFLAALISFLKSFIPESPRYRWLFIVAFLVVALVIWLCSCTSNHYFSINAEEMTNPSIEYRDSTNLQIPF